MSPTEYNIIIVGAGPVGLFTALRLSDFGISCLVLEAESELQNDLRASTFHPPTLDIMDEYGITSKLLDAGRVCETWQIRMHTTGKRAEFDLSVLKNETSHPYRLQCEQSKLCRFLMEELQGRSNVEVRFGHRVDRVDEDDEKVTLTVNSEDSPQTFTARHVIGADGARSIVRSTMGLSFDGMTYPETTILATTEFRFEDHLENLSGINYVWKPGGTFTLLHLPDLWRCSLYPDQDETIEEATRPESIEHKLQQVHPKDTPYDVLEIRAYRLHMRIVENYRKGRLVLVGDAAHLNSPSGGMGMNGGLHDAFILSDKFRQIENGADTRLLDQYTRQRRPVAYEQILKQADSNRKRMQERDPQKRQEAFDQLLATIADADRCKEFLMNSSMISGWRRSQAIQ